MANFAIHSERTTKSLRKFFEGETQLLKVSSDVFTNEAKIYIMNITFSNVRFLNKGMNVASSFVF